MCFENGEKFWSSRWYKISPWRAEIQVQLGQGKSSHRNCFIKIGFLKNFAILTGNHLCWSLFLIKLLVFRPPTVLVQVVFLWILWNFKNTYFEDHPAYSCFWLGIQKTFVFSFWKNVFYWNQIFLRLDFSLFSHRGFDDVLKRAFLNFLFRSILN